MNWPVISLAVIVLLAFVPFWIVPLAMLFGADVGPHSSWAAVPWLIFYTLPAGGVAFVVWMMTIIYLELNK